MYLPFAALCRQHNCHALYWREMVTGSSADHLINDAYESPQHELMSPKLACHYPMTSTSATEIIGNKTGAYNVVSPGLSTGPAIPLDAKYGRGGGVDNPTVINSTTAKTVSMSGPLPSGSDQNPVGITGYGFTLSCWYRVTDLATDFDASGDDDSDGTTGTIIGIQNHNALYSASGLYARIQLRRRKTGSFDPGYWLSVNIGDGSTERSFETDPSDSPWEACMQDELWHYVSMIVSSSKIELYLDGIKLGSISHTYAFPTPRFRVGVNTDWRSSPSIRAIQLAYASVYKDEFSRTDAERHFNSMRRPLDMKVNYNADRYSTNLMTHIGGDTQASDLDYSPSSRRAEHRHDGRWVHMVRLNEPYMNDTGSDSDNDLQEDDCKIAMPRHWSLASSPSDDKQAYRYNTHTRAGGSNAVTTTGTGATMIAGWEGMMGPRSGAYNSGKHDYTILLDWTGKGNTGGSGINRSWTYDIGANDLAGGGSSTTTEGTDGRDGFALSRVQNGSNNRFEFWTPWESTTPLESEDQLVISHDTAGADWRYQAIGASGDSTSLILAVFNPPRHTDSNSVKTLDADSYQNQPSPTRTVTRMVRNQAEREPRMLWCNRDNHVDLPSTGNSEATDKNRYGPLAMFPDRIDDLTLKRMLRVMHGQPLMRTRPGLRAPFRHFQMTAPTRSLT